jgi:hypothetical protein
MPYALMIIEPVGDRRERTEEEGRALFDSMLRYSESLQERGLLLGVQSLRTDAEAVRVQLRGGRRSLVDGPFSESKEMVGGFFLLNCEDKARAIELAAECPAAQWATVEVRETGPCFT